MGGEGKCSVFPVYTLEQILCKSVDGVKPKAHSNLEVKMFKTSTSAKPKQCSACIIEPLVGFGVWFGAAGCEGRPPNSNFFKEDQKFVLSQLLLVSIFQDPKQSPKPAVVGFLVLLFNLTAPKAG